MQEYFSLEKRACVTVVYNKWLNGQYIFLLKGGCQGFISNLTLAYLNKLKLVTNRKEKDVLKGFKIGHKLHLHESDIITL